MIERGLKGYIESCSVLRNGIKLSYDPKFFAAERRPSARLSGCCRGKPRDAGELMMDCNDRDNMKEWVERWKRVGPILDELRREAIRNADTALAIELFDGCVELGLRMNPPRPTSGLVEQQRYFRKARR